MCHGELLSEKAFDFLLLEHKTFLPLGFFPLSCYGCFKFKTHTHKKKNHPTHQTKGFSVNNIFSVRDVRTENI